MRGAVLAAVLLATAAALHGQPVVPDLMRPDNRTISQSKQFTVFGGTRSERSDLVRRAEELKSGVLRELRDTDHWKAPILIVLAPGDGVRIRQAPVTMQVFDADDAGRKIQIDFAPGALADSESADRAILRAVLLEMALRPQKIEGGRYVHPPEWLGAALAASVARSQGDTASLYANLLEGKGMPRMDRFLRQNAASLQGRARELHAAQSLALYEGLAELPDGHRRILNNLMLPEPDRDPVQRFAQTWPELEEDPPRLARIWALSVARLSAPKKMELYDAEETGKRLGRILSELAAAGDGEVEDEARRLLNLSRTDEGRFRLSQGAQDMQRLGFRAHPLYAPLVEQYRELLDDLGRKRRRGFERHFNESEELRLTLDERIRGITDFMNWYQASKDSGPVTVSAAAALAASASEPAARRNDRISRYLDSIEQRGW